MPLPRAVIDIDDYKESWNWLLYGPAGIGKTSLAVQLDNNLILSVEKGTARRGTKPLPKGKNVKVWPIPNLKEFEAAYDYLNSESHPFKTVTIDTGTALQELTMKEILEVAHNKNPEKFDRDVAQLQDYLKMQKMFRRMVNDFNDLPINTLWIAHMMEYENGDGDVETLPAFEGKDAKMARFMCHTPDVVTFYYEKADKAVKKDGEVVKPATTRRRLLFKAANFKFAKTRFDVFGTVVDMTIGEKNEVTFNDLVERINNPDSTKPLGSGIMSDVADDEDSAETQVTADDAKTGNSETQATIANNETKTRKFRAVSNEEE